MASNFLIFFWIIELQILDYFLDGVSNVPLDIRITFFWKSFIFYNMSHGILFVFLDSEHHASRGRSFCTVWEISVRNWFTRGKTPDTPPYRQKIGKYFLNSERRVRSPLNFCKYFSGRGLPASLAWAMQSGNALDFWILGFVILDMYLIFLDIISSK